MILSLSSLHSKTVPKTTFMDKHDLMLWVSAKLGVDCTVGCFAKYNMFLMVQHQVKMLSTKLIFAAVNLSTYCWCCLVSPPPPPKVMPSMDSNRKHTSKAHPSSRATLHNSSTQANRATRRSSKATVSLYAEFTCLHHVVGTIVRSVLMPCGNTLRWACPLKAL